jgi:hypothetical protein
MKPTLPEDRELEKMSSEVSERYRASAQDEPPARLDAAVLAAARRDVGKPVKRRNWQMPASIAAVLVIGISLVLMVRDNEPPLPSLGQPAADEAKLAKSAPAQLAMKAKPRVSTDPPREARPSRERSARPDREPQAREEVAIAQGNSVRDSAVSGAAIPPVPAPAAPAVAAPAKSVEQEGPQMAVSGALSSRKKAEVLSAIPQSRRNDESLQLQDSAAPVKPQDWLRRIDDLLRDGKDADARAQLLDFRKQFPSYPLAQRLQALLPPDQR